MSPDRPQIVLRRGTLDDLGEIITVQRAAFLVEAQLYGHPHLPPLEETIDQARAVLGDGTTEVVVADLVRARGPRLVGVVRVRVHDGAAHIGRLAVAPDLMGLGIGSRLLQHVHDHPPLGAERFALHTALKSEGNQRWYASHGYRAVGTTADPLGIEVVTMERPLRLTDPPR